MNKKNKQTYDAIYQDPIRSDIKWPDVVSLFSALGTEISEESGSRVRFKLNGERAVFHRPHPGNIIDKAAIKGMRQFLENAEVVI